MSMLRLTYEAVLCLEIYFTSLYAHGCVIILSIWHNELMFYATIIVKLFCEYRKLRGLNNFEISI